MARGGKVIVRVRPELVRLFKCIADVTIVTDRPAGSEYDLACSMLSLAMIFKTRVDSIPAKVPYLWAEPKLEEQWKRAWKTPFGMRRKT